MINGIDVSTWQGTINWEKVKAAGVKFAMIRAGFGINNIDSQFVRNISECNRVGIPCGVYWFSYALSEAEATREASYCLTAIRPYKVDYPVVFDFEYDSTRYAQSKGVTVNKAFVTALARAFCTRVKNEGYIAGVYTNLDYSRNMIDLNALREFELWYAWYSDKLNRDGVALWQHSNKGRVDGIAGDVDLDYCFKTFPPEKEEEQEEEESEETGGQPQLDNTPSDYAKSAVDKAVARGILRGTDTGNLMLHSPVTRQDLFVFLDRLDLL